MKRIAATVIFLSISVFAPQSHGQEFWYVPPGLDYGARAGINLGYGAGFGYGVGAGFGGNQGLPAVPLSRGERQSVNPFSYLDEPAGVQMEVPNSGRLTTLQRQVLLQQSRDRQHSLEQRRLAARDVARARNARYFKYLEDHKATTTPEGAAD